MKKKISFMAVIIILFISLVTYFKTLSLSKIATKDNQLKMVFCEYSVKNGNPFIDSISYQTITSEQKDAVLTVLKDYPYRRTLGTLFSDGSISDFGSKLLYIYVYDGASQVDCIAASSAGTITLHGKNYHMENAEQFIEQILEIIEHAD